MRNTHTLTHKSDCWITHSLLILLFILAVGGCVSGAAVNVSFCAPHDSANCAGNLLPTQNTAYSLYQFNQAYCVGNLSPHNSNVGLVKNYQRITPISEKASSLGTIANHPLVGNSFCCDAVSTHLRLPFRAGAKPGRSNRGEAGLQALSGIPYMLHSASSGDEGEEVATRDELSNPQSTTLSLLSQTEIFAVSVLGQQPRAL